MPLDNLEQRIEETKKKIVDVKKRWPFHSAKPALFEELEKLELELEELTRLKKAARNTSNKK